MTKLDKIVHACVSTLAALSSVLASHARNPHRNPQPPRRPAPHPRASSSAPATSTAPSSRTSRRPSRSIATASASTCSGEPTNADANPQLMKMFGLPDARLVQNIGRAPPTPGGVEIVEISRSDGERVERAINAPGTVMLTVSVRDIEATLARLKRLGAPVITSGGAPVALNNAGFRGVLVKDPAGHFVELVQYSSPRPAAADENANIVGVRVRHTVENLESAIRLYQGALGLQGPAEAPPYTTDSNVTRMLGLPRGTQWRYTTLTVPTSGLLLELIEFKGSRRPRRARARTRPRLDANPAARRGHRRGRRGAHAGRRHVHVDGREAARSARGQQDAQGRHRARSRRLVHRADSGAAGAAVSTRDRDRRRIKAGTAIRGRLKVA